MALPPIPCGWLRELAAGYLRPYATGYLQQRGGLWGYFLERRRGRQRVGFFAGFLTRAPQRFSGSSLIPLEPPECAVFAFVHPRASRLYHRLVRQPGSPFRRSYELLTKYTARRPRFEFREEEGSALIRHLPLAAFPPRQREKYARNFFLETLALVVRSGLPERLLRVRLSGH